MVMETAENAPLKDAAADSNGDDDIKIRQPAGGLFKEVNDLRKQRNVNNDDEVKYNDTFFGKLAGNKKFEGLTFVFIGLNSVYIGIDADYSARTGKPDDLYDKDTPIWVKIMENIFCIYFTAEVVIRFIGYRKKTDCVRDAWFIFDTILVVFMVLETWIFPIFGLAGQLAQLSVLRLLRLLRISRMARLMKKVPELMIIIKGLIASVRSVGCTAILQVLILYVWAIVFVSEYHENEDFPQGSAEDNGGEAIHDDFGNMRKAMFSLFIMGTVLDDVTYLTDSIRATGNKFMLFLFIVFVLISSFTILNMLIGILCEVVSATADSEKTKAAESSASEAITNLFNAMDLDKSGNINKDEFLKMRDDPTVRTALEDLDIYEAHFQRYCEILFYNEESKDGKPKTIDRDTLITMILRLSPGNHINALDFSLLQASLDRSQEVIRERILKIQDMISSTTKQGDPSSSPRPSTSNVLQVPATQPTPPRIPGTEVPAAAQGDPAGGATSSVISSSPAREYTLDMFVRTSSHQIIEELERRLGVSASEAKAAHRRPEAQKEEAFHTIGVPEE